MIEPTDPRPRRSHLSVPAHKARMVEKAAASAADLVMLDLEDSVPAAEKPEARQAAAAAIDGLDWGGKVLALRVNGLDTPYFYRDLIDVLEAGAARLDTLVVPKVTSAADVHAVALLLAQIEAATARGRNLGLDLQIENAAGLVEIDAIARQSARARALHFGSGDFAASIGARIATIGGIAPFYGTLTDPDPEGRRQFHAGDVWHYALARLVVAARAAGLQPIDGPLADFRDREGFLAQARRVAALGCAGKWCIHPDQIPWANEVFTPDAAEIAAARAILAAMRAAAAEGRAAVVLDGRMIDIASVRQAEMLAALAARLGL